ncbi:MAG: sortase [Acidobacteria bacterium]|nr:sortase [Acidobacteriota bacterium]
MAVPEIDFRFLDPPEPGAHARLAVTIANRADAPTGPLGIVISRRWLQDFQVIGAVPDVADDRPEGEGERRFAFAGLAPGQQQTFEVHVVATADEVDAPEVRVLLGAGDADAQSEVEIGRGRPRTVAPRPRPGPARAVAIPKLGVRAAVVPVPWEPPAFVIGQVHGSAAVSEGNTVLIGHFGGPQGDVFARLSQLRPGDEVVATSRGLEYRFIVSDIAVRPYDDVSPTYPTETPRLTLMTCTGQWSILRQDYSHRLWVVAEPADLAQQTIRANAERAAQAAREAEAAAAERAAHEAEVSATATAEAQAQAAQPASAGAARAPAARSVPSAAAAPSPGEGLTPPPPLPSPSPSPAADEPLAPGIVIDGLTDGAPVPTRLTVRGRRTAEADTGRLLWLVVRAEVDGSRWYALDRQLTVNQRGEWEAAIELGGPAGVRHQIRVLSVDADGDATLRRHANERRGHPLDVLPVGSQTGARVTVERR